ncbi:hypothetical protein C2845_PM10G03490 [Panicum miliaceum]|uniref:F-box domain-containing protein n=1 Tax=Panicum miliaceum TaxID=4540 RepID=A0A3L6PFG6_PANMI|nr:hypothetical protein C2845_PM10G03490 [Panicum miliaceum]
MGSTAAAEEDARVAKRARLAPPAGDADLISGLDDDVLLRVLGLAGDARDAARTGALSRRWLGLWTRAPALRFASQPGGFWSGTPPPSTPPSPGAPDPAAPSSACRSRTPRAPSSTRWNSRRSPTPRSGGSRAPGTP